MARIKDMYKAEVAPALMKKFEYKSVMQIPKLDKIVINCGVGDAKDNSKALDAVLADLTAISGQKAVPTFAKKSVANFKLREGMKIGVKVTLRGERMYPFVTRDHGVKNLNSGLLLPLKDICKYLLRYLVIDKSFYEVGVNSYIVAVYLLLFCIYKLACILLLDNRLIFAIHALAKAYRSAVLTAFGTDTDSKDTDKLCLGDCAVNTAVHNAEIFLHPYNSGRLLCIRNVHKGLIVSSDKQGAY